MIIPYAFLMCSMDFSVSNLRAPDVVPIKPSSSLLLTELSPLLRQHDARPEALRHMAPERRARHGVRPTAVITGGALLTQGTAVGPNGPRQVQQRRNRKPTISEGNS